MIKSVEESIVTQAIKDLGDKEEFCRVEALLFFVGGDHLPHCRGAGLDGDAIEQSVIKIAKEFGARREKMIKDLIKDIPRY